MKGRRKAKETVCELPLKKKLNSGGGGGGEGFYFIINLEKLTVLDSLSSWLRFCQ